MENKADEARGELSKLYTSKKPLYTLFSFSIFIVVFASSLSLPFRFHSYVSMLTSFVDTNDRHYIFLLCNGILVFLFLDSGSKHTSHTRSRNDQAVSRVYSDDLPEPVAVEEGTEAKQIEHNVISVSSVVEEETEAKQNEQDGILVGVDDHDDPMNTQDQIEDPETELVLHVDDENEVVATVEVEEEEHDEEESNELFEKCEAFIKKVRRTMHHEARPNPHALFPV